MRRLGTAVLILAAIVLVGAAVASDLGMKADREDARRDGTLRLRVVDEPAELYPGARQELRLRVANMYPFMVTLAQIKVKVADASPECPASYLEVATLRPKLRLRPGHGRALSIPIAMLADAPDACQGASFPLTFRGKGRRS